MSNYRMDIKGDIGLKDYSNIYDYLSIVDINDNFTIIIDRCSKHEANILSSMLNNNYFHIYQEGYNNNGNYQINAYKIK